MVEDLNHAPFPIEKYQPVTLHGRGIQSIPDLTERVDMNVLTEMARIRKILDGMPVEKFQTAAKRTDQQLIGAKGNRTRKRVTGIKTRRVFHGLHSLAADPP